MERILLLVLFLFPYIFSIKIEVISHIREAEQLSNHQQSCSFKTCYGLNCTNYTCDHDYCVQVVPIGSVCSDQVVCEAGTECVNKVCVRPIDSGCPCQDNSTCIPSNLYCAGDYRCGINRTVGSLCDLNRYCHSNICNQYQCACKSLNETCVDDDDCCTEYCSSGICRIRTWSKSNSPCVADNECISGLCIQGVCVRFFSVPQGGACKTTLGAECVPGLTCVNGACAPPVANCSSSCGMFGDCICLNYQGRPGQECQQVLPYSCVTDTFNAYADCLESCLVGQYSINPDGCNYNCYEPYADFICCLKISPNPVIQTHYSHANCTSKSVCQLQPCCTPGGCTSFEIEACIPPPSLNESSILKPLLSLLYIIVFVLL